MGWNHAKKGTKICHQSLIEYRFEFVYSNYLFKHWYKGWRRGMVDEMTDRSGKDQFQVEPCQPSASFSHYWSVAINVHLFVHNTLAPYKHSRFEQILCFLNSKSDCCNWRSSFCSSHTCHAQHRGLGQIIFCLKCKSLTFPDLELFLDQSGVAQHLIRISISTHQILPHLHIGPGLIWFK